VALTVGDVLDLDVFKLGAVEVVAGAAHLGRTVRWVHISELPDIAYLLKGGELLLTTGMALGGQPDLQRRYIRDLAEVGAAGLVIELGRTFERAPTAMVEEAERASLPLIALHRETRYVDVTEQVHAAIINRQFELLEKAEAIGRDFTRLVLRGVRPAAIVRHLSSITRNPVVLEDSAHQVVECSSHGSPMTQLLHEWDAHSRAGHVAADDQVVVSENGTLRCAWIAISFRDETWGRLHVLPLDSPIDEVDRLALDRAGAALSLALLADRDAAHLADHARGALISEILEGTSSSTDELLERAHSLGIDLRDKKLVAIAIEARDLFMGEDGEIGERDRQQRRAHLLAETRAAAARAGCVGLSASLGDRVMAVVASPNGDPVAASHALANDVCQRVSARFGGVAAIAGVSGPVGPDALRRAFDDAREAARYGLAVGHEGPLVYRYGELGLHQLMLRLADGPELARFVESELGPLLASDARSTAPLLPTLRAYLDCGGLKTATAASLGIERRSIYHRLERIRQVLQRDLGDPEVRARLVVALRGLEFLKRRSPRPTP
jgi:purine catabolism regulator